MQPEVYSAITTIKVITILITIIAIIIVLRACPAVAQPLPPPQRPSDCG